MSENELTENQTDGGRYRVVPLRCVECGKHSTHDALHWRSYRTDDPTEDEPPGLAFYCPTCAEREFGSLGPDTEYRWFQS